MLAQLIPADIFAAMLVFARVGAAVGFLPGFGDLYVPARIRLVLALALTVLLTPMLLQDGALPVLPGSPLRLLLLIGGETLIGLFLGLTARILMAALETAGMIISMQMSLSNAIVFNPGQQTQDSLVGGYFALLGVTLMFVTDLHHLMLTAVVDSYGLFQPGVMPPIGDMSNVMAMLVARSFMIAVQLASPFLVIGIGFYTMLGLLSRLMPALQVFFIALPLQIMGGFLMLILTTSGIMLWFLGTFQEVFVGFGRP
jgi:flagellar biosynthetic protein FliR